MHHAWPGRFWHGTSIHFSLICLSVPLWVEAIVCCWIIYQLITQCLLLLASGDTVKRKKPTRLKPIESAPQQNGQLDSFKQPKKDRENFRKTLVDIILWVDFDFAVQVFHNDKLKKISLHSHRYVCICMHAHACTHTHTWTHIHRHRCMHLYYICMHKQSHTCTVYTHTFKHTCTHMHAFTHIHIHAHSYTHSHTCMHARTHTCTHTRTHTRMHAHTDTHTQTHTRTCTLAPNQMILYKEKMISQTGKTVFDLSCTFFGLVPSRLANVYIHSVLSSNT